MDEVIRAEDLTKVYRGGVRGVDGLEFTVGRGEVFGFLGPNGAGKTTTIRLLLDLIRPTSGRLAVFGLDSRRDSLAIRQGLGYVPGDLRLYERLTAREALTFFAHLRGSSGLGDAVRLAERLELELDRPLRALSTGNRQKAGLVQAFMHEPECLILDEPIAGLDPLVQRSFHDLLGEVAAQGRTVFLSSHTLSEVERVARRVAILRRGHLVVVDTFENLRRVAVQRLEIEFDGTAPPTNVLRALRGVREVQADGPRRLVSFEGSADPIVKAIAAYDVRTIRNREADLEEIFLRFYRDEATP
jgi:ABC-2 type transport system ATP-binding protein